jgi:hypothetical protein
MALSRLLQRRGEAPQWSITNPVLESGELGIETDTKKLKLGDGRTAWNDLVYVGGLIPGDQGEIGLAGPAGPSGPLGGIGPKGSDGDPGEDGPRGSVNAAAPMEYDAQAFALSVDQSQIEISEGQIVTNTSTQTSSYTVQSSDANSFIGSSTVALSISVPDVLQDGQMITFIQTGVEKITFSGQGITLNTPATFLRTRMQYAGASVAKVDGSYYLFGDLE